MKTIGLLFVALFACCASLLAAHIRGGELTYRYMGAGTSPNTSRYELTLKLYVDCGARSEGQLDEEVDFSIFSKTGGIRLERNLTVDFTSEQYIRYDPRSNPCILNPPTDICYRLRYYTTQVTLNNSAEGYTVSFQRCCRIDNIRNMSGNSGDYGATYTCDIPGTNVQARAYENSSPIFNPNDAIAICAGSAFEFDFSAIDTLDRDSMAYDLCNAYVGGGREQGTCFYCTNPSPTSPPPYSSVGYRATFNGANPMGNNVSINEQTGLIKGIAPNAVGQYVVTVCAREYRQGVLINTHRKDIHISVSNCQPLRAVLDPDYSFCDDFNVTFQNGQVNPAGAIYIWDFGDGSKKDTISTALGQIQHQYTTAGSYEVKLKVLLAGGQCSDSTTTVANVFPGFFPGFTVAGSCVLTPFRFIDTTFARYGSVSKWNWSFGDETTNTDVSTIRNPSYRYNSLGTKTVTLEVETTVGCKGSATVQVEVRDRPELFLAFRDTLICSIDELPLIATAPGTLNPVFTWTPGVNIRFANTPNPIVDPKTTTTYRVRVEDDGCTATDSVRVRVVDFVTLSMPPDTTICLTDPVTLRSFGDGLRFEWTPTTSLDDPTARTPVATPTDTTTYTLTSRIGGCWATDAYTINTVPYPGANAGENKIICYDDSTMIVAQIDGAFFNWSPTINLLDANTLTPIAHPLFTTNYVLTVTDTVGCPKPFRDTVQVLVRPPVIAFAGNDTAIVVGQPLQLQATGAEIYSWQPSTGLNASNIPNPVALINQAQTYIVRVATEEDCHSYDTISVVVFTTAPDIFVPNAFSPGKSVNGIFRPIPVGIAKLDYFRVFNRWGQMVYSTSTPGEGWDGKIGGKNQASDTYVWMVQGRDFTGRMVSKRGTVVLIR